MEFLKALLSEDTYNKLAEELKDKEVKLADLSKGEYVAKAKYDTAVKDVDSFKEQLAQRDSDLETLKKTATLSEEQTQKFNELQGKYESEKKEWETKLEQNARDASLEIAIASSGTKDPVSLKAHLGTFLKDAEFKDGKYVGLEEHIKTRLGDDLKHLSGEALAEGTGFGKPPKTEISKAEQIEAAIFKK